jgi:hypothetical protein
MYAQVTKVDPLQYFGNEVYVSYFVVYLLQESVNIPFENAR